MFEDVLPPPRAVGRLVAALHDGRRRRAGGSARRRSCATSPAARPTAPMRRPCGTSTTARRSPKRRSRTAQIAGAYHRIAFHAADGDVLIETSRPELIVSCVALVAHPDDERYQPRFGTSVRTPLFDVEVPVVAHPLADPDKGTGIAMICTFGDVTDVTWWRELDLPTRSVIGRDGRFTDVTPDWIVGATGGRACYRTPRRPHGQAGANRHGRGAARVRRADRRAAADHPPGEVLRARPAPAGDRHQPAVVHPQRRARRRPPPGPPRSWQGAGVVPRPHAPPLRPLGRGAQRRLADQPAALLRRADPAVVPRRRRR